MSEIEKLTRENKALRIALKEFYALEFGYDEAKCEEVVERSIKNIIENTKGCGDDD
jgi:hypothetical protein